MSVRSPFSGKCGRKLFVRLTLADAHYRLEVMPDTCNVMNVLTTLCPAVHTAFARYFN